MNKSIFALLLSITLLACEDSVKFEEPQPSARNNLNKIPGRLRGKYRSISDQTFLTITESQIIEWTNMVYESLVDSLDVELDSNLIVNHSSDSLQIIDGKYNLKLKFTKTDSVSVHYSYTDTIFEISNEHILRRFKGHYFLNYKQKDNNWSVRRLSLNNKGLIFSRVRLPEDISELKEITEIEVIRSDSGKLRGYKLNPTKKELRQLMKHQFRESKTYVKTKISNSR